MRPKEGDPHPTYEGVMRVHNRQSTPHIKEGHISCIGCPVNAMPDDPTLDCDCGEGFVWYGEHMKVISIANGEHK